MNAIALLIGFTLVILIMSYGVGMIAGGPNMGQKVFTWEVRQLSKIGRWTLKQTLQLIVDLCRWIQGKL